MVIYLGGHSWNSEVSYFRLQWGKGCGVSASPMKPESRILESRSRYGSRRRSRTYSQRTVKDIFRDQKFFFPSIRCHRSFRSISCSTQSDSGLTLCPFVRRSGSVLIILQPETKKKSLANFFAVCVVRVRPLATSSSHWISPTATDWLCTLKFRRLFFLLPLYPLRLVRSTPGRSSAERMVWDDVEIIILQIFSSCSTIYVSRPFKFI